MIPFLALLTILGIPIIIAVINRERKVLDIEEIGEDVKYYKVIFDFHYNYQSKSFRKLVVFKSLDKLSQLRQLNYSEIYLDFEKCYSSVILEI